jgi:hypothetical protein
MTVPQKIDLPHTRYLAVSAHMDFLEIVHLGTA